MASAAIIGMGVATAVEITRVIGMRTQGIVVIAETDVTAVKGEIEAKGETAMRRATAEIAIATGIAAAGIAAASAAINVLVIA